MGLAEFSIRKKVITTALLVVVFFAGVTAYFDLPRAEDPGFTVRTALVTTAFPGASPDRVELLVTDPLERAIEEQPEVDHIESTSRTGFSVIEVEYEDQYMDMQPIFDDLRTKVEDAAPQLPAGARPPTVNDEFGDVYGTLVGLTGEGLTMAELDEVAEDVRSELLTLSEVAKVQVYGRKAKRIYLEYNGARLAELGLSAGQLAQILESRNILISGGSVETKRERLELEPTGNFGSVDELRQAVVRLPTTGQVLALEDIVDVRRGYADPPTSSVHYSGRPGLVLGISLREGGKITQLGEQVQATLQRLEERYPIGLSFDLAAFQPEVVERQVNSFVSSLLQGVVAVIVVMLVSLGLRTGLMVASVIPMTMIATMWLMQQFEIGLNKMSIAGLIIALGMLVDNAIVIAEAVLVEVREGKGVVEATVDTAQELRFPLFTSSLTTVAALLPIYLAESAVGEYTAPITEVVAIALIVSWVLALTLLPLLIVAYLKRTGDLPDDGPSAAENGGAAEGGGAAEDGGTAGGGGADDSPYASAFYERYRQSLLFGLRRRGLTVAAAVALFAAALWSFQFVPQSFFPKKQASQFTVEIELPYGVPFDRTEALVSDVEGYLADSLQVDAAVRAAEDTTARGVTDWTAYVGRGAPRFVLPYAPEQPRSNYAYLLVNITAYEHLEPIMDRLQAHLDRTYPSITARVERLQNGPPIPYPVEVRISGDDPDEIFRIADRVKTRLDSIDGVRNIKDNWGARTKRLRVDIHEPRVRRAGLSNRDVARSLQAALDGIPLTEFREGNELYPVVLRSQAEGETDPSQLESVRVYSQQTGTNVPLAQVADLDLTFQPSRVLRYDRKRTVTVQADLAPGTETTAFAVANRLDPWLQSASQDWPIGYSYDFGGKVETSGESQQSIFVKLPLAALIVVLLLIVQFNSIRKPLIILVTIPLGLIGVIAGLLMTQKAFGFMSLLGVIALSGIVIKNAVVLIDRIEIEMNEFGRSVDQAIIEASQRRLRPILLTTATTCGGLIPLWLSGSPLFSPMAVTILFGLLFSTALTLGLVPVLYALLYRVSFDDFTYWMNQ